MKEIKRGMKNGIPIALGYLSVSFSFGAIAVSMGFSVIQAVLISLLNLTSAGQFASLGIIAGQGTYLEIEIVQQFFKTLEITSFSTFFYSFFASITHILRSFISKCGIKNIFFYFLTITMKELIDDTIEDINRFIIHFRSECYISI